MHIAMIGQRGVPATYGGIERHVEELGARLVERGHLVTVYARNGYGDPEVTEHRGMNVVTLPTIGTRHLDAAVGSAFATMSAMFGPADIVHVHALGPGVFAIGPRLHPRKRVVQTIHGLDYQREKWGGFATACLRAAASVSAYVPNRRVVVSRDLERHYIDDFGVTADYIPNGITPMEPVPPSGLLDRIGVGDKPYLLFVGRLVPEKRPDLLVKTFTEMETDHRLLVVGGSSHTDDYVGEVQRLADADDRIFMPGYLYDEDLREVYTNASGFVLPSTLEGLPLTLLDAIGAGLPVLASDIGAHRELIPEPTSFARLFGVHDQDDFVDGLRWLMTDDAAVEDDPNRATFLRDYSWERATDDLERVYLEIAPKRRRARKSAPAAVRPASSEAAAALSGPSPALRATPGGPVEADLPTVLYIAGTGRSGSTLVSSLLGEVPGAFAAGELRYFWQRAILEGRPCGCRQTVHECELWTKVIAATGLDVEDIAESVANDLRAKTKVREVFRSPLATPAVEKATVDAVSALYSAIAETSGCRIIVDSSKLPPYGALVRDTVPMRFKMLHLTRDPRAASFSWQRSTASRAQAGLDTEMLQIGTARSSLLWHLWNRSAALQREIDPTSYLHVRYEDLVRDPSATLRTIGDFVGIPAPDLPAVVDHQVELHPNHTIAGNPGRFSNGMVTLRDDAEWRTELAFSRAAATTAISSPVLRRFGYGLRWGS